MFQVHVLKTVKMLRLRNEINKEISKNSQCQDIFNITRSMYNRLTLMPYLVETARAEHEENVEGFRQAIMALGCCRLQAPVGSFAP